MKSLEKELIYLYCVTDKVPKLKELEKTIGRFYFVYHEAVYAVFSKVQEAEFSEENLKKNMANWGWVKVKVGIHEKVIESLMKNSCVIPFKFGTLFHTEDNLKLMVKENAIKFKDTLKYLENKEEWGVKIYCDIDKLKENLIQEDKGLLDIDKKINSASPGKAFILKKKKEELVATIVNKKLNEYGHDSFERFKKCSIQSRINKLLPKEVTERKEDMILNSVFLIDKSGVTDFIDSVDILKRTYAPMGLFFDYTGPWPPYNFCEAKTFMERSKAVVEKN